MTKPKARWFVKSVDRLRDNFATAAEVELAVKTPKGMKILRQIAEELDPKWMLQDGASVFLTATLGARNLKTGKETHIGFNFGASVDVLLEKKMAQLIEFGTTEDLVITVNPNVKSETKAYVYDPETKKFTYSCTLPDSPAPKQRRSYSR